MFHGSWVFPEQATGFDSVEIKALCLARFMKIQCKGIGKSSMTTPEKAFHF